MWYIMAITCIILYILGAIVFYLATSTGGDDPDADACGLFWMTIWPVFLLIVGAVILIGWVLDRLTNDDNSDNDDF